MEALATEQSPAQEQNAPTNTRANRLPAQPIASGSSQVNVGNTERIVSAAAGGLLLAWGLRGPSWLAALTGGYLLYRGASGNCPVNNAIGRNTAENQPKPLTVRQSLTIRKPKEELYAFWRQLENLPRFMHHLEEVTQIDSRRSHWKVKVPTDVASVQWDAEIVQDEPNQRIAWRSVPGSTVDNSGEVFFADAPGGRGTEIHTTITYRPPAGAIGAVIGKLINPATEQMVKEDLRRFKQLMEAGEIPTIEGQSSGRGIDNG